MSKKRIFAVPNPGIAHGAVPIYALPSGELGIGISGLQVFRGDILLSNPANVVGEVDLDEGQLYGFAFRVTNPEGNPDAFITEFGVSGAISFFQIFNTSPDPTGITLGESENIFLVFLTDYFEETLREGRNTFTGTWHIKNTFAGNTTAEEINIVNIHYTVVVPFVRDNKNQPFRDRETKISPNAFIDEFIILNTREDTENTKTRPRFGGNDKGE